MRCALYVRVSTEEQGQPGHVSFDVQDEECRRYAQAHGWEVAVVYKDEQSGLDASRPRYQQMLAAAQKRQFEVVLAYDPSRFGRDAGEAITACKQLESSGVTVQTVKVDISQPFVRNLFFALGEEESRTKSVRVSDAMRKIVELGRWPTKPPMGYDLVREEGLPGGKLVPNEKADAIRRLFELYATGTVSLRALPAEGARLGLTYNGRPLARQVIHKLLHNPAYAGKVIYGRTSSGKFTGKKTHPEENWLVADGVHEALVSQEVWDRVQERLAFNRQHASVTRKTVYLCTGFIYCGHCGSRMFGHRFPGRSKKHYYRCEEGVERRTCHVRFVDGEKIDAVVKYVLGDLLELFPDRDSKPIGTKDSFVRSTLKEIGGQDGDVARLRRQQEKYRRRLKRLLGKHLDRLVPKDVVEEQMAEERRALDAVERELAAAERKGHSTITAESLGELWDWLMSFVAEPVSQNDPREFPFWRTQVEFSVERIEVSSADDVHVELNAATKAVIQSLSGRLRCR